MIDKRQSKIEDIVLDETGKRKISTHNTYIPLKKYNQNEARKAMEALQGQGAEVIVASKAFGVDDGTEEREIA